MAIGLNSKVLVDAPGAPGVWTVTKVNPTTLRLEQGGRAIRAHRGLLTEATPEQAAQAESVPLPAFFAPGTVVRVDSAKMNRANPSGLWVVLSQRERVKVAPLGGASEPWSVGPRALTALSLADLKAAL